MHPMIGRLIGFLPLEVDCNSLVSTCRANVMLAASTRLLLVGPIGTGVIRRRLLTLDKELKMSMKQDRVNYSKLCVNRGLVKEQDESFA